MSDKPPKRTYDELKQDFHNLLSFTGSVQWDLHKANTKIQQLEEEILNLQARLPAPRKRK